VFVGTSDQLKSCWPRGCCRKLNGTSDRGGSELPTLGQNFHPSEIMLAEDPSSGELWHFRWGSELPTPTEKSELSARKCMCVFCRIVSFSSLHLSISRLSFRVPLNSTVLPTLKFKIEIYKSLQGSSCTVSLANMPSLIALFNFNDFKSYS
jgi:hypothetical protein